MMAKTTYFCGCVKTCPEYGLAVFDYCGEHNWDNLPQTGTEKLIEREFPDVISVNISDPVKTREKI